MADNTVTVVGNVPRPELRYTTGGRGVASFGLAVNRRYQVNGEWQEQTSFFNVVAWGTLGENAAASVTKGTRVVVTAVSSSARGRPKTATSAAWSRSWLMNSDRRCAGRGHGRAHRPYRSRWRWPGWRRWWRWRLLRWQPSPRPDLRRRRAVLTPLRRREGNSRWRARRPAPPRGPPRSPRPASTRRRRAHSYQKVDTSISGHRPAVALHERPGQDPQPSCERHDVQQQREVAERHQWLAHGVAPLRQAGFLERNRPPPTVVAIATRAVAMSSRTTPAIRSRV